MDTSDSQNVTHGNDDSFHEQGNSSSNNSSNVDNDLRSYEIK